MTHNELLAYLAGIVDGEGYLGIKRDMVKGRGVSPVFYERISVASTNRAAIDLFCETFKCGKVYVHRIKKLSKREYWSWEVSNKIATGVLAQLYPYLRIKKPEADIILKFRATQLRKYRVLPAEVIARRQALYEDIKALHAN